MKNTTYLDKLKAKGPQFIFVAKPATILSTKYPTVYIDGSYDTTKKISGWGFVVVENGKQIHEECGHVDDSPFGSRNITGEIMSSVFALKWADKNNIPMVVIYHDYIGLGQWAAGHWKTKAPISIKYKELLGKIKCKAEFRHVKGHTGNVWNEAVDKLAEQGKFRKLWKI
jgi:ribonuclease HI